MQAIDEAMLLWLAQAGQTVPGLDDAARVVTELGGHRFLIPLSLAAGAWLFVTGHARRSTILLCVIFGGRLAVDLAKALIDRPRPALVPHLVEVLNMSFPSGHAGNSMIVYLALALIAAPPRTSAKWPIGAAVGLSILIGLTRPVLGVHWPSDVVAGWVLGVAWTLIVVRMSDRWVRGDPRTAPIQVSR